MNKNIFVNMAVKDLKKSTEFFTKLGYTFNQQFTDETATSMIISENIYAMLLTEPKMKEFTKKDLVDAHKATEVLIALSCESKDEVNSLVDKAVAAGAEEPHEAKDYGFMYTRTFEDLDGHIWEILWMEPSYVK